ncbi:DNA/RNA non-specific endonuclease, partial [Cooperia oncophora]
MIGKGEHNFRFLMKEHRKTEKACREVVTIVDILAAAGNHRKTQKSVDQTFLLTNMSPQVGKGFNRDKWNDLERYARKIAKKSLNTYILTGPLYLPHKAEDGNNYVKEDNSC